MEKFVIIDGNNLMYRAFYALPQLANFQGEISNGVFGFANMLIKVIKEINPKYLAVAFDVAKKNFRHEKFSDYKGTRKPTPPELKSQFPIVKDMLEKMNIKVVEKDQLEADDLIGCLSRMFNVENIILSGDRDVFQLINKNTTVMFPKKGISETITINDENLKELYGVTPSQVVDLKSLMGDASDNIPGVSGIGEKTAIGLIEKYGNLDCIYNNINDIKGKLKEKLEYDKEYAYLSRELATIVTDEKLDYVIEDFEYDFPFNNDVLDLFKRYQFNSLLKQDELFETSQKIINKIEINFKNVTSDNIDNILEDISKQDEIAIYTNEEKLYINGIEEYLFDFGGDLFSCSLNMFDTLNKLKPIFESNEIKKIIFNAKEFKHFLNRYEISLNGVSFDCLIARYLINSNAKQNVNLDEVIVECGIDCECCGYALKEIKRYFYTKLEELDLLNLYYNIELPLIDVLFSMEKEGFKVDENELKQLEEKYSLEIKQTEELIYECAGEKFNIASPKQLAEILFDKLNLNIPTNKKKSTSIDILTEIQDKHSIIPLIIRYRMITKLYSTYIVGFQNIITDDSRIHSVFNQTVTSTGRLSSSEPNLQNIPVRSEEGRLLRKVFVPTEKNGYIVSADYSQIEIRLLANFSQDEKLIDAFNKGQDIHTRTASEIFGVPMCDVTSDLRRNAKEINFGIIYGISDFGLSQSIGSTRKQAKEYMDLYFSRYPSIEEYMNKNIEYCQNNGYIKTLFGRIRLIPEIHSSNFNLRSFGKRAAMNMPLQGSASDIIKLAMVKTYEELKNKNLKSKIILQVHDELVVDTYPDELEEVKKTLKDVMENIVDLEVRLTINISSGNTWYDAK